MECVGQGQSFQRRRRNRHKRHKIVEPRFEWRAYWFICLIWVQLVFGEVREEWGVENVDMVETYMRILGACLPWGVLFSDTPQGYSRVQGFVSGDLE
jgi:hypothetical protein